MPDNITFLTMCFNIGNRNPDKNKTEKGYEEFYLKSLERLIKKYKKVVLWCDKQTDDYIKSKGLKVHTKVMKFEQLPFYKKRNEYIKYIDKISKSEANNKGTFYKEPPEQIVDYFALVLSKIELLKWAKDKNFYNSEYFYWIDAGSHNEYYNDMWKNWDGIIDIKTDKFRCAFETPQPKIYKSLIELTTFEDIALLKREYTIYAGAWIISFDLVDNFYNKYMQAIKFTEKKQLIMQEEGIFLIMLKMGEYGLFEFTKVEKAVGLYNIISKPNSNKLANDKLKTNLYRFILGKITKQQLKDNIMQRYIYRPNYFYRIYKTLWKNPYEKYIKGTR